MKFYKHLLIAITATLGLGLSQGVMAAYIIQNDVTVTYSTAGASTTAEATDSIYVTVTVQSADVTELGTDYALTGITGGGTASQNYTVFNTGNGPLTSTFDLTANPNLDGDSFDIKDFEALITGIDTPSSIVNYSNQTQTDGVAYLGGTVTAGNVSNSSGITTIDVDNDTNFKSGDTITISGTDYTVDASDIAGDDKLTVTDASANIVTDLGSSSYGVQIGESLTFTLDITQTGALLEVASGDISYEVTVTLSEGAAVVAEDTSTVSYTLAGTILFVEKSVSDGTTTTTTDDGLTGLKSGDTLIYTITIRNDGDADASSLTIVDSLSSFVTYTGTTSVTVDTGTGPTDITGTSTINESAGTLTVTPNDALPLPSSGVVEVTYTVQIN